MRISPFLLIVVATPLFAQNVTVAIVDDIAFTIPDSARIAGIDRPINWKSVRSLSALAKDSASLKILAARGVEVEVWVRRSDDYVTGVNRLTRMQWLTFTAQMSGMLARDAQKKNSRSVSSLTGEYIGGKYRAILGRSSWYEGDVFHNTLILDLFHHETLISLLFTWSAPEGSEAERIVDTIVTSVGVTDE